MHERAAGGATQVSASSHITDVPTTKKQLAEVGLQASKHGRVEQHLPGRWPAGSVDNQNAALECKRYHEHRFYNKVIADVDGSN